MTMGQGILTYRRHTIVLEYLSTSVQKQLVSTQIITMIIICNYMTCIETTSYKSNPRYPSEHPVEKTLKLTEKSDTDPLAIFHMFGTSNMSSLC